jgi:hypothetical protein
MYFNLLLKAAKLLRVDRQTEILGMDITKHGEPAYPTGAYERGQWMMENGTETAINGGGNINKVFASDEA